MKKHIKGEKIMNDKLIKRILLITKCEDCNKECSLRQLCGTIPKECPLPTENTEDEILKIK